MSFVFCFAGSDAESGVGNVVIIDPAPCHKRRHTQNGHCGPYVNNELSSLITIMRCCFRREKHIPYRNSSLGKLLQNILEPEGCRKKKGSLDFVFLARKPWNHAHNAALQAQMNMKKCLW
eukprot:PhF_6_TR42190/c0_g2_i1/m.63838